MRVHFCSIFIPQTQFSHSSVLCYSHTSWLSSSSSCLSSTLSIAVASSSNTQRRISLPGRLLKYHLYCGVSMTVWQCRLLLCFLPHPQWCSCVFGSLLPDSQLTVHSSVSSRGPKQRHLMYLAISQSPHCSDLNYWLVLKLRDWETSQTSALTTLDWCCYLSCHARWEHTHHRLRWIDHFKEL